MKDGGARARELSWGDVSKEETGLVNFGSLDIVCEVCI
jgi:hypothetical protein